MKIKNKNLNRVVSFSFSLIKTTLGLLLPMVSNSSKSFVKRKIVMRAKGLNSSFVIKRSVDRFLVPIKLRRPVKIASIPIDKDVWTQGVYYVEEHNATNLHYDLSIIVNGKVYRMARSASPSAMGKRGWNGLFPGVQERTGWIAQPEHYPSEVPNPPIIHDGYGKGTTKIIASGNCLIRISNDNAMHVIFEDIPGVYVFIETQDSQILMIRKHKNGLWIGKHSMNSSTDVDAYIDDPDYFFFEKKDGAAIEWCVSKDSNGKKYLLIHSYRQNQRILKESNYITQIDHTYRLSLCDNPLPDDFPICAGRGELWYDHPDGRICIARLMNSNHYAARSYSYDVKLYVHDINHYEGRNVSNIPYGEKLDIFIKLRGADKRFNIPPYASDSISKEMMWGNRGNNAQDGVVAWNMNKSNQKAIKIKFCQDQENWHSATIIGVMPQSGKKSESYAYPIVVNEQGISFVVSGQGLTNEVKQDMFINPDKYIGQEIRYSADSHFDTSGKPFQPTIKEGLIL